MKLEYDEIQTVTNPKTDSFSVAENVYGQKRGPRIWHYLAKNCKKCQFDAWQKTESVSYDGQTTDMNDGNHVVEHHTSVREHQELQKQRKRRIGKIPSIFRQKWQFLTISSKS